MANKETNRVLAKLKNTKYAKTFSEEYFENMADWSDCKSHSDSGPKYLYTLKSGKTIECDSRPERNMVKYLDDRDLYICLGSQALCIKYDTAFKKDKNYFPDFVLLTKDYHIAIIEVKSLSSMSYHLNLEKYKALEKYCKKKGFEYMMVDPDHDYKTLDQLRNMRINPGFEKTFVKHGYKKTNNDTLIDKDLVTKWYDEFGKGKTNKTKFKLQIHSLIVQKGWYNTSTKNDIRAYKSPVMQRDDEDR